MRLFGCLYLITKNNRCFAARATAVLGKRRIDSQLDFTRFMRDFLKMKFIVHHLSTKMLRRQAAKQDKLNFRFQPQKSALDNEDLLDNSTSDSYSDTMETAANQNNKVTVEFGQLSESASFPSFKRPPIQ